MLGNGNPVCDAINHRWLEEYYGYKCENCGAFVPYGCEPWLDDDDAEQSVQADIAECTCEKPYQSEEVDDGVCGGCLKPFRNAANANRWAVHRWIHH